MQSNQSEPGVFRRYAHAQQRKLTLDFGEVVANADITALQTLQTALINATTKRVTPFWLHLFYDEAATLFLTDWEDIADWEHVYRSYLQKDRKSVV